MDRRTLLAGAVGVLIVVSQTSASAGSPAPSSSGDWSPVRFLWSATGGPDGMDGAVDVGIAPDGDVWVADDGHDRFAIFSPDGTFRGYWGTSGKQDGQLSLQVPDGAFGTFAFAPDGSFYVINTGTRRIAHFAADRSFLSAWGGFGSGPGQYADPVAIAVDNAGIVYVLDDTRGVIEWTDPSGNVLGSVAAPGFSGLALDSNGNLYTSAADPTTLLKLDRQGKVLQTFGSAGSGIGQFADWICAVTTDAEGRVFVVGCPGAAPATDYVQVFAPDGTFLARWSTSDASGTPFAFPSHIALDGKGSVYIEDLGRNRLSKFHLLPPLVPDGISSPRPAVSFDPSILDGTWVTTVTPADSTRTGLPPDDCLRTTGSARLLMTIDHGTYIFGETCAGVPFSIGDRGAVRLTQDTFTHLPDGGPSSADFDWSLEGNVLDLRYRDSSGYPIEVPHEHLGWEHAWTRQP